MLTPEEKGKVTTRELRVVKRGDEYLLRKCDVGDDPPTIVPMTPARYAECKGKNLEGLYEQAVRAARREIEEAMDKPVVEER